MNSSLASMVPMVHHFISNMEVATIVGNPNAFQNFIMGVLPASNITPNNFCFVEAVENDLVCLRIPRDELTWQISSKGMSTSPPDPSEIRNVSEQRIIKFFFK